MLARWRDISPASMLSWSTHRWGEFFYFGYWNAARPNKLPMRRGHDLMKWILQQMCESIWALWEWGVGGGVGETTMTMTMTMTTTMMETAHLPPWRHTENASLRTWRTMSYHQRQHTWREHCDIGYNSSSLFLWGRVVCCYDGSDGWVDTMMVIKIMPCLVENENLDLCNSVGSTLI